MLAQYEGDLEYKSFLRQDLWRDPSREPRISLLHTIYQETPKPRKLKPIFSRLKTDVVKALGRDIKTAVVGVPVYTTSATRQSLREQLQKAGFNVLATVRLPALLISTHGFDTEARKREEHTILVVDLNRASLDITILTTQYGTADVLGFETYPALGEEALDLALLESVAGEHLGNGEPSTIAAVLPKIRLFLETQGTADEPQDLDVSPLGSTSASVPPIAVTQQVRNGVANAEEEHFQNIRSGLEAFISNHTRKTDPRDGSHWIPLLSELTAISLSGDASSRSFASLRRVIASSATVSKLEDLAADGPPPVEIGARGAALNADLRVLHDHDLDAPPNYVVHEEL